jgi:pimeloyl-ACP methyl ester carboxylesterase
VAGSETAIIPNTGHWMFDQAAQDYCRIVMEFLAR